MYGLYAVGNDTSQVFTKALLCRHKQRQVIATNCISDIWIETKKHLAILLLATSNTYNNSA